MANKVYEGQQPYAKNKLSCSKFVFVSEIEHKTKRKVKTAVKKQRGQKDKNKTSDMGSFQPPAIDETMIFKLPVETHTHAQMNH